MEQVIRGLQSKGLFVNSARLETYSEAIEQNLEEQGVEKSFALLINSDVRKVSGRNTRACLKWIEYRCCITFAISIIVHAT